MQEIRINVKEEPAKRVEPISKSLTFLSCVILTFILCATIVALLLIPSPDGETETFLRYLLRNMNLIS